MQNEIEHIRKDIKKYFDPNNKVGIEEYEMSETGLFHFTIEHFRQNDLKRNWIVSKIQIYRTGCAEPDFEYIASSEDVIYHYCWMIKDNIEYLLIPEAMGGQSIYHTKTKELHSFYNEKEPFIWLMIYPSPDGKRMAVEGCYWACPNELRIYDTSEITNLPYSLIHCEANWGNECVVEQWEDADHLTICKNKKDIVTLNVTALSDKNQ